MADNLSVELLIVQFSSKRARGRRHKPNGSDYICDRVMLFIFQYSEKKSQKVGKKETPVQNRPVTDYRPQTQSRPVNSTQSSMQRSNIQGRQAAVRTAGVQQEV